MSIRLVVFDLDGTLVDSLRDLADSANALLVESGAQALARADIGRMVGDGAATLVARAFAAAGIQQPADALDRYLSIYDRRLLQFTRPYEGIEQALEELGRSVSLAVLTNKPLGATREILSGLKLDRYFSAQDVLGGDGPFPRKPDPAGLHHLLAAFKVSPNEVMVVGDSMVDLNTARAAGTKVCLAAYGFGFSSVGQDIRPGEQVVQRPSDLPAAVRRTL